MSSKSTTVLFSAFDRAFIAVVETLADNWSLHRQFRFKQELFDVLGYSNKNWPSLKNGKRKVPVGKRDEYRKILIKKFNVRPGFLDNYKGSMFTTDAKWLRNSSAKHLTTEQLIDKLREENSSLKKQLRASIRTIQQRDHEITRLKNLHRKAVRKVVQITASQNI